MIVVTFEDVTPLPRYDGNPWTQIVIEEAADRNGPWVQIDSQALTPVDADPANPATRNFTTENAALDNGWYHIIFQDATGDSQQPTAAIHNSPDEEVAFYPSIDEVAELERARTKDKFGVEVGTFTANTRPTDAAVRGLIKQAAENVIMVTDTNIPSSCFDLASAVIAIVTAMYIELSYFPEQVGTPNSAYDRFKDLYDAKLERLLVAIEREQMQEAEETGGPYVGDVQYSFPPMQVNWDSVNW